MLLHRLGRVVLAGAMTCFGCVVLRRRRGAGLGLLYDALYAERASSFGGAGKASMLGAPSCLESGDSDLEATDAAPLPSGITRFFLFRANNPCGPGSLGEDSAGSARSAPVCL